MLTLVRRMGRICMMLFSLDRGQRRRVHYHLCRWMAQSIFGCYVGGDLKLWLEDMSFWDEFLGISTHSRQVAERTYAVRELVRSLSVVPGDTVEIGVFQGRTSYFICQARGQGEHHAFDSFEGLSEPMDEDKPKDSNAFRWKSGDLSFSEQLVRDNLAEFDGVRLYKGWVPERFDEVAERRFAFVHIDVDLYRPTLDSIAFFYPRLHSGGMLVCDDYGFTSCPGAYRAMHEYFDDISVHIIHLPTGQGLVIKPYIFCHFQERLPGPRHGSDTQ